MYVQLLQVNLARKMRIMQRAEIYSDLPATVRSMI